MIENKTGGSILSYITTDLLKDIIVELPEEETLYSAADFLLSIDKKVRTNHKINNLLQQMAQTTYIQRFFHKPANGKLGDMIKENPKSAIQVSEAKGQDGGFPFFTSGDSILRWKEPLVDGRNCFLNTGGNAGVKFYVGKSSYSTDTWCITAEESLSDYLFLFLISIKPELNKKYFQGTGLKHLQKTLLRERPVYIPSKKEIEDFNKVIQPYMTMISGNTRESQMLISLRDCLLPMLMNGYARIGELSAVDGTHK